MSKMNGGTIVAAVIGVVALGVVLMFISAFPVMLVLGALHSSEGLGFVPALGFWQTLGSLFIVATIGNIFRGSVSTNVKGGK